MRPWPWRFLVRDSLIRQVLLELLVNLRSRLSLLVERKLPVVTDFFQPRPQLGGRANPDLAACLLVPSSSVLPLLGVHMECTTDLLARR